MDAAEAVRILEGKAKEAAQAYGDACHYLGHLESDMLPSARRGRMDAAAVVEAIDRAIQALKVAP